ncbi:MAG: hypothetical protein WC006_09555 [Bacilli bacterium]|nr:hypothetical protein [Bacilli bacterium]
MRNKEIRKIVFASLFAAIASVIKILTPDTGPGRIGFFQVPIMLSGYYLGGGIGLVVGLVADSAYMIHRGYGPSLFTLSTMIWGLSGGILRKFRPNLAMVIIVVLMTAFLETTINSFAIAFFTPNGAGWITFVSGLSFRGISFVIRIPFYIVSVRYLIQRFEIMELDFQ